MKNKIYIRLENLEQCINKFNPNMLSNELNNYIIERSRFIPFKSKIELIIEGVNDEQQDEIKTLIHSNYKELASISKIMEQYDNIKRLFLFVLGVILICVSELFQFVVSELFLVAGWVVIWELVYDILFDRVKRHRNYFKYVQLSKAKITFK